MSKQKFKLNQIILVSIILIGGFLRFISLEHPLWPDEALYAYLGMGLYSHSHIMLNGLPWAGQPPFFIILVTISYFFFGSQEFAPLIVSPVLGTIGILGVYLLSKELFNKEIGLLSAFFIAIMPSHWLVSRMIVADITVATLLTFSLYLIIKCMKDEKMHYYVFLGILMGILILTKKIGLIIYPVLIISILSGYKDGINISLKKFTISILISIITQVPWHLRNFLEFNDPLGSSAGYMGEFKGENVLSIMDFIRDFPDIVNIFILLFSFIGIYSIIKQRYNKGHIILAIIGLFIILFLFHKRTELTRYLVPITPFFAILAGLGFYRIYSRFKMAKQGLAFSGIIILIVFSAGLIDGYERIDINRQKYAGYEETAIWLEENIPNNSKIITNSRAVRYYSDFETEYFPLNPGDFLSQISRENHYAIISQWPTDPATPKYTREVLESEQGIEILARINEKPPYIFIIKGG